MRKMIRYNNTGEVLVIDPERKLCTLVLSPEERTAPLADYELDQEFFDSEEDYSVIKSTR